MLLESDVDYGGGDGVILCYWSLMWMMVVVMVMALYCATGV